jgi:hypothetical protein
MSADSEAQPTRVAVIIYRHTMRHIPEYLLVQENSTSARIWQLLVGDVVPGANPAETARRTVEQAAGYWVHGDVTPVDYCYSLPLWGSVKPQSDMRSAPDHPAAGVEAAYMAEVRPQDGDPQFNDSRYGAFRWVSVIDAVSLLRYPEHVEALMRVSGKVDASGSQI